MTGVEKREGGTTLEPLLSNIVTAKKEKDPRRVEAGKRLAAISKQAKERKRRERETLQNSRVPHSGYTGNMVGLATVGVVVAVATLWYKM